MPKASQQQINIALEKIKNTISDETNGNFQLVKRKENEDTLIKLGYLHTHFLEVILELTYKNYCNGPEMNVSNTGNSKGAIWVFGKNIDSIEIYIKIHIVPQGSKNQCICISFHEATRKLNYPYA